VISPRATRLVRVPDLWAFRDVLASLARDGAPFDARDRLIVVPTRAAAEHLVRSIENRLPAGQATAVLPDLITPGELTARFAERLPGTRVLLTDAEREALLGVACRTVRGGGTPPPFRLRPRLIAEILRFYDTLRQQQKDVATFARLALGALEPGAANDRGAERLVRQTRFLVDAFREFERLRAGTGALDDHALRAEVLATPAPNPWRHVVLAVIDRARDPFGLYPRDWDLLALVPGVERVDVVVTNSTLGGALHERIHQVLPGIEEVHVEADTRDGPVVLVPPGDTRAHVARDREEEVAGFARWVKQSVRDQEVTRLDRVALVVRRPLPYVYVAREVLRSAGIPCQMFDALPLAGEPYAAAVDLVCAFVSSSFARVPAVSLLRSPHFRFGDVTLREIATLDRALSEAGYLGDSDSLKRLVASWGESDDVRGLFARARKPAAALQRLALELLPLRATAPVADHLDVLVSFLRTHENLPGPDDPLRARQLRARAAILASLTSLRDAHRRFDSAPVDFDHVATMVRRWIEAQTFAPRTGDAGVHIVDAESAKFGDFDHVQLAGLVDGEWPAGPRRNIFYSPAILKDLGWTAESERIDGARAAFVDLMRLPRSRLRASRFSLEGDAIVGASAMLDEMEVARLGTLEHSDNPTRIFEFEALGLDPAALDSLAPLPQAAARRRFGAPAPADPRYRGTTDGHPTTAYSLSALERYQDCPFKFFAADVLQLEDVPEDEETLSPRARGRFIHEVFQRFFEAWDRLGVGVITADRMDEALTLFETVAAPMLAQLPEPEAGLERARLYGSAIAVGLVEVVLSLEASRHARVVERWLERRFEGEFALGAEGRRVVLKGVADRIDLLAGDRLRVIDYKSGSAPNVKRALQVPIYALWAQETLSLRDGRRWSIEEASYVAFSGKRALVPVIKAGATDADATLAEARSRLFAAIDGVSRGAFPPRPHDPNICGYCAFASVCRKDYVGDE
jgi:RecB family exonuclease